MKIKTPRKEGKRKHLFAVYGFDEKEMDQVWDQMCNVYTAYHEDPKIKNLEEVFIGLINEIFPDTTKGERCKMAMLMLMQFHILRDQLSTALKCGRKKAPLVTADDVVAALVSELQKKR